MDVIDVAQRRQLEEVEHTLLARRPASRGLAVCEVEDCEQSITEQRQAMGARRCVPCATAVEQGAQRCRPRAYG